MSVSLNCISFIFLPSPSHQREPFPEYWVTSELFGHLSSVHDALFAKYCFLGLHTKLFDFAILFCVQYDLDCVHSDCDTVFVWIFGFVCLFYLTLRFWTFCLFLSLLFRLLFWIRNCFSSFDKLCHFSANSLHNTPPAMDPADVRQLQALLAQKGEMLLAYQEQTVALQNAKMQLQQSKAPTPHPPPPHREPIWMAFLEKFDDHCRGFLHQCDIFLSHIACLPPSRPFTLVGNILLCHLFTL